MNKKMELDWKHYKSVSNFDDAFWKTTIGKKEAKLGKAVFSVIESLEGQNFHYFLCFKNNNPIGLVFLNITTIDLGAEIKGILGNFLVKIRKFKTNFLIIKSAMTGTHGTIGKHWWYDPEEIDECEFVYSFLRMIENSNLNFPLLIFRDFLEEDTLLTKNSFNSFKKNGFFPIQYHPTTTLHLFQKSLDQYIAGLNRKTRATIRKANSIAVAHNLTFEVIHDYSPIIDEIYPLYIETNNRAKELVVPALPKDFFLLVNNSKQLNSMCFIIRNNEKKIISFTLAWHINNSLNAFCLGFDYTINRDFLLIYQNYLFLVKWSIMNNVKQIEMGMTNYFIKKRFGCILNPISFFIRFRNPVINLIFSLSHRFLLRGNDL